MPVQVLFYFCRSISLVFFFRFLSAITPYQTVQLVAYVCIFLFRFTITAARQSCRGSSFSRAEIDFPYFRRLLHAQFYCDC